MLHKNMKRIKHHLRKLSKSAMKKRMTAIIILLFGMAMLFQKDTANNTELQFVRNADEVFMHNAANTQWDYLFEDEGGQQVYQGQLDTGTTNGEITGESLDNLISQQEINELTESGTIFTGNIYTGNMNSTGTQTGTTITGTLDCIAPRGEEVKNRDFVLAYEQRTDVNTICNVEKRICMSGTLEGSFAQRSCKDDVIYDYRKAEVISYNQKVLNEYIQPTAPINSGANFNTQGQLEPEGSATTTRGTTNTPTTTDTQIDQSSTPAKKSCTTPRGQTIKNGQFIKAYKTPRGFVDLPCDVELRPCIDGKLKGSYTYAKCTFNNTTYTEYLKAGSPSSSTGFLFFERIKSIFKK